ncbi:YicC/YloC family endoribonuclease [uncultured Roseovarius sp.]|uniref:YicC/YloC family endoribonuclease n=1 Tax=uncultured Roseovarius sp. TaxID=293344 RepID=UPI0025E841DA|nr:YicC/YloC family endoribonuclease [uncultured Roseovarius sp.]
MLRSMTAFASAKGATGGFSWTWELRSVNGKGLDLRLRVPDWIEGLEAALRAGLSKALTRGNVNLALRVQAEDQTGRLALNAGQLHDVLTAMAEVEAQAMDRGLSLAPATAADILGLRGVLDAGAGAQDTTALRAALLEDFEALLAAFVEMRETEGAALKEVLDDQLDQIATLTEQAAKAAEARQPEMQKATRAALVRVMENTDGADEARVAQELALIAVKADVTEEIDRLRAHVQAARGLLAQGSPIGRKIDFLSQEFNREANTLCSKAQNAGLTSVGLDLKAVIDQMREQVQNVE